TLLGSSSPLGNLQTAFALPSLAASVVNKENQKNFRRMLTHPPAAGGPTTNDRLSPRLVHKCDLKCTGPAALET
ncbi:hypothetical protein, partial [uncultured Rikenella sp.]|uniref:hypothetical protein n=1 Tax=uncultured Rikenella sp. TaxID=368003 RepID=UPI00260EC6B0